MKKQSITLLAVLVLVNGNAFAAPTNEQLYQMLLEVKAEQGRLKQEVTQGKKRESALQLELTRTQDELVLAKQQLNQPFEEPEELAIKEGFFMSAGGLYVRPLIDSETPFPSDAVSTFRMAGNEMDYERAPTYSRLTPVSSWRPTRELLLIMKPLPTQRSPFVPLIAAV